MADKSKKPSTRKQAHTIPLTHRQQRTKKRPQSEQTTTPSASMPRAAIPRKQPMRAHAPAPQTPRRAARATTLQPKPAVTEAATKPTAIEPAVVEPVAEAVAEPAEAIAEPVAEPAEAIAEPVAEPVEAIVESPEAVAEAVEEVAEPAAESEPDEPRRVRVRVRRKTIPLEEDMRIDITRQDTTILPAMTIFPPQPRQPDPAIVAEPLAEEAPAPLHAETLTEPLASAPDSSELAPELLADEPELALDEPEFVADEPEPEFALDEPKLVADEPEPVAEVAAPEAEGAEEPMPELPELELESFDGPTAALAEPNAQEPESLASDDEGAEDDEELEQPERRRMPTLAVMVALAPRAETTPTTPLSERELAEDVEVAAETLPEASMADETLSAPEVAAPSEAAAAEAEEVAEAEEPVEIPAEEPAAEESDETSEPPLPTAEDVPAQPPRSWMWWAQRPRRQAAPETRPIAAMESAPSTAAAVAPIISQDAEQTAPRRVLRRTETTTTAATPTPAPTESRAARTVAKRTDAEVEALAERRRAAQARQRAEAKHSTRAVVLSWAGFGHAAVASVAALVAVVAGLRLSAGGAAQAIFGWALALALIAGLGAWFGYLCAQLGRPLLATLALLLSQLGALAWALGLLGPRAALLALAPASVALALRGAGRLSAIGAGLAWFTFYLADLALTLLGAQRPHLALGLAGAALVDVALTLVGLWLIVNILISLYTSRVNVVAHGRAVEHVALYTEAQLDRLRTQTEDDAEALRQALLEALRGEQPARVYARGPLSAVAEIVNEMADRLVDLRYDRTERKRLESATRRLTRVIERAWLGLSWSWPDATGTILDDLLALLRTPPPPDAPAMPDETSPTGQVVAPHLFRGWRPTEPTQRVSQPGVEQEVLPGMPSVPSQPSAPTLPSLLEGDTSVRLTTPLELPPSPRWRGSSSRHSASDQSGATDR